MIRMTGKSPRLPRWSLPAACASGTRSTKFENYQMEFQGQIEKRSLSWAFRASNAANYYAAKIVITKPGPQPNAGLVHYAMLSGHEFDRVQLPLPVTLAARRKLPRAGLGAGRAFRDLLERAGHQLLDGCPFEARRHRLLRR